MPAPRRVGVVTGAVLALLSGTALPAAAAPPPGTRPSAPIIGGTVVTDAEAPWGASIYRSGGSFSCSGTIIAPTWVLTAAHCVGSGISVRVGSVYRSKAAPATVKRYEVAPGADLALIELTAPQQATFSQLADADPPVGSTNQICGWGYTGSNGPVSEQLKCADVKVTSTTCRDYRYGLALCSTKITGNAWSGDSGGPERYDGKQVGVASTADGRAEQTYGSVPANRSWIRSVAGV
ncbi:S1 family peptidase [Actinomadura decatromicini]|uniref:Serine protease n=1 Tax=Actinomadura decatromicini TaxID=2604572 RepID=A0A5D3FUQ4_9ACTN|nr:serine protease [Actinomadura decatromicini]TYK50855.1 serine protease [Actinomadura decatromicini]